MQSTPILSVLEAKDDATLSQVISQAQTWLSQSREQARDVLLDEPILRFMLVQITKILERRYREYDSGGAPRARLDHQAHAGAPGFRPGPPMQGQFYDFQGAPPPPARPPMPQYGLYGPAPPQPYPPYEQYYGGAYQAPPYYGAYPPQAQQQYPPQAPELDLEAIQRQVMAMSEDEIARLAPEVRAQVEQVRAAVRQRS
jgi:hypothetical protein